VAVDSATNLYVADTFNHTLRKMTPVGANWIVTTLAGLGGSPGSADGNARFHEPNGVALDSAGNLYVADFINSTIRKMTRDGTNWVVTTAAGVAGSLAARTGRTAMPGSIFLLTWRWTARTTVYVAETANNLVRKITLVGTNWVVTTVAETADRLTTGSFGT
jgi:hypothetical protein